MKILAFGKVLKDGMFVFSGIAVPRIGVLAWWKSQLYF